MGLSQLLGATTPRPGPGADRPLDDRPRFLEVAASPGAPAGGRIPADLSLLPAVGQQAGRRLAAKVVRWPGGLVLCGAGC